MTPAPRLPSLAPLKGKRIALIGGGTMGFALAHGLIAQGFPGRALTIADPIPKARRRARLLGAQATPENCKAISKSHVIILAVKPQEIPGVLEKMSCCVNRKQLVISIAAGITLRFLKAHLPGNAVVRAMPNLPATLGCGFTAYAAGRGTTKAHRRIAKAIFDAIGVAVELPENLLDTATAISASGPAYLFLLVQAWRDAGVRLGLPRKIADQAVRQTVSGSVKLLENSKRSPEEWIRCVASRRGTTEAALRVLGRRRVAQHIEEAIRAATQRSKQLSRS